MNGWIANNAIVQKNNEAWMAAIFYWIVVLLIFDGSARLA
jgi:hypothetical protein